MSRPTTWARYSSGCRCYMPHYCILDRVCITRYSVMCRWRNPCPRRAGLIDVSGWLINRLLRRLTTVCTFTTCRHVGLSNGLSINKVDGVPSTHYPTFHIGYVSVCFVRSDSKERRRRWRSVMLARSRCWAAWRLDRCTVEQQDAFALRGLGHWGQLVKEWSRYNRQRCISRKICVSWPVTQ